jgi:hypothetical protein
MPVTVVIRLLGVVITGVVGPDTKVHVGLPAPTVPDTPPVRVVEEPQMMAFPPAFTVQLIPCAYRLVAAPARIARYNATIKRVKFSFMIFGFDLKIAWIVLMEE